MQRDSQVAVFQRGEEVFCVDNLCYHNGGPLYMGDIEELKGGHVCIICPWHKCVDEVFFPFFLGGGGVNFMYGRMFRVPSYGIWLTPGLVKSNP